LVPRPVTEIVFSDLFLFLIAFPRIPRPITNPRAAIVIAIMFLFIKLCGI
jgi:hypothetical protein